MRKAPPSCLSCCACAVLAISPAIGVGETIDWRYALGLHDLAVPEVSSDTFGIDGSVWVDKWTDAGRHYFGSFDLLVDHDKDHLDPDHIPIWWMLHAGSDGKWWQLGAHAYLGWTADVNTRMNTASSIERQIKALPAVVLGYGGDSVRASVEAGIGYFFQEIDDDAPKLRGFDRTGLRQTMAAESIAGEAAVRLGTWRFSARAQQWRDGGDWLESQYNVEMRVDVSRWIHAQGSEFVLGAEVHEYNLDIYPHSDEGLPILGWDDDLLIRLSYSAALRR